MKNKTEREEFLHNYKAWDLFAVIGGIGLRFYQVTLANGAKIVATENEVIRYNDERSVSVRYRLLLPETEDYSPYDVHSGISTNEFKTYSPTGHSVSQIVDYLTKRKSVI